MSDALYDKTVRCLYCEKEFTTKKVRSNHLFVKKRDSDFCVHYEQENPYFYEVNICPHCGFAFTESFSSSISAPRRQILKEEYIDKIRDFQMQGKRTIEDAQRSFKLALVTATLLEESQLLKAGLCMRIAWLYRYQQDPEEKRFLQSALYFYQEVFKNTDRLPISKHQLLYIIGELNLRLNREEDAKKWFSVLFGDRTADDKVVNMARNRWAEYRGNKERSGS